MNFARICLLFVALLNLVLPASAEEVRVHWQVVQPFRYLKYESDHRMHEWAYAALSENERLNSPVYHMERLLNNPRWWGTTPSGGNQTYLQKYQELRATEVDAGRDDLPLNLNFGWASALRNKDYGPTHEAVCWDTDTQSYLGCLSDVGDIRGGSQYVLPESHIVELWLEARGADGSWNRLDEQCVVQTSIDAILPGGDRRSAEKREWASPNCGVSTFLRVPYKTDLVAEVHLGVAEAATGSSPSTSVRIAVEDYLVVGMGDSFGSGEGNPEVPARLDREKSVKPYFSVDSQGPDRIAWRDRGVPRRAGNRHGEILGNTYARWADQRCHRSIYSAQARAAIALALHGDRHHAVTFVSTSCSGAEVADGLFWPQDGRECLNIRRDAGRLHDPQISALVDVLSGRERPARLRVFCSSRCRSRANALPATDPYQKSVIARYNDLSKREKLLSAGDYCEEWPGVGRVRPNPILRSANFVRPIDVVFLSIGGNDMGFAPLVKNRIINRGLSDISGVADVAASFYRNAAGDLSPREALERLPLLKHRFTLLQDGLNRKLEMKTGSTSPVKRVTDPEGRFVKNSKRIIYSLYPDPTRNENGVHCGDGAKGMNVARIFYLKDVGAASHVISKMNEELRRLAGARGWTVVDGHISDFRTHGICATTEDSPNESGAGTAEIFDVPSRRDRGPWRVGNKTFHPVDDLYPYESRQRWLRTINDAFLIAQYFKRNAYRRPVSEDENFLYFADRSLGGPVHPTAQGHARTADHLYCAASKLLFGSNCNPDLAPAD